MWDTLKQEFGKFLNDFRFEVVDEQDGIYTVEYLEHNDTCRTKITYRSACAAYFIDVELVPYHDMVIRNMPVTNDMTVEQLITWVKNITAKLDY